MKVLRIVIMAMLMAASAFGADGTITGTFRTPNTSVPLRNATVTLTLNQAAVVAGEFSIAPSAVSCYTSTDGNVKGMPNPKVQPSASGAVGGGTITAATYSVTITYYDAGNTKETLASPARSVTLGSTGRIIVTGPTVQPSKATGYRVYVNDKLQATTTGFGSTTVTAYNSGGAASPATNNSTCTLVFNDALIPSGTTYRVSVVDTNSNAVPGWPQSWWLSGSTVDVSTVYPIAVNVQTRFPQPVIANPSSNALQSVNSPLTLNTYGLTAGALTLNGVEVDELSPNGSARIWYNSEDDKLYASVNGGAAVDLLTLAPGESLSQSEGGTGNNAAIAAGRLVYSDGTKYQGTAAMTWNATLKDLKLVGRYTVHSADLECPASDSGSLQMLYPVGADQGFLYASVNDGVCGGTGKGLQIAGSYIEFATGNPNTLSVKFKITSTAPQWLYSTVAADEMEMTATLAKVPTDVSETQAGWLPVMDSNGDLGYIPFFK